jgi:predicted enzyme related to lactoylglutathione lyase
MLEKSPAFSSYAVDDIQAAKQFYSETLGLEVSEGEMGFITLHLPGGRDTMIYPKPDFTPATYTVLNFPVDDVDAEVEELASKGVAMLRYDGFEQDDKGIARDDRGPAIAWFTDPAGNVLAVLEGTP